jgi:hypothetical protein
MESSAQFFVIQKIGYKTIPPAEVIPYQQYWQALIGKTPLNPYRAKVDFNHYQGIMAKKPDK